MEQNEGKKVGGKYGDERRGSRERMKGGRIGGRMVAKDGVRIE